MDPDNLPLGESPRGAHDRGYERAMMSAVSPALVPAALEYHARGYPVLPIGPDKRPLCKWGEWLTRPQTEAEVLALPWDRAHGLAIVTWPGGPLIVLDIDGPHGWDAWRTTRIPLPQTATVRTRSGGTHLVFSAPEGIPRPGGGNGAEPRRKVRLVSADCACEKRCGVDLLLSGYFVTVPTPAYVEDPDHPFEPGDIATIPQAILDLARRQEPASRTPADGSWLDEAMRGVPEGARDDTAVRLAGYWLHRLQGSVDDTLRILRPWATRCEPPFPEADLLKCVQSVGRKEAGKSRTLALPVLESPVTVLRKMRDQGEPVGTGLGPLDDHMRGGIWPGRTVIIVGPPHVGKTNLLVQIGQAAAEKGYAVLYLNPDEGREPAAVRIGQQLGYERAALEDIHHPARENTVAAVERTLAGRVLRFPDLDAECDNSLEGVAEALAQEYPDQKKLLLVDSIQTVHIRGGTTAFPSVRERILETGRCARRLAGEHTMMVVLTSEANRGAYRSKSEGDRTEDISSPAEARLEYSCDTLIFLRSTQEDPHLVDTRLVKNRVGTRGQFFLRLDSKRAKFDVADREGAVIPTKDRAREKAVEEAIERILRTLKKTADLTRTQLLEVVGGKTAVFAQALMQAKDTGLVTWNKVGFRILHRLTEIPK